MPIKQSKQLKPFRWISNSSSNSSIQMNIEFTMSYLLYPSDNQLNLNAEFKCSIL